MPSLGIGWGNWRFSLYGSHTFRSMNPWNAPILLPYIHRLSLADAYGRSSMSGSVHALPASIELQLKDAGFSPTELLILRNLLGDGHMTLRQVASKTGKSTGVLDQAMKKLLRREIVHREVVNGAPQYNLRSLQPILRWMASDTQHKRALLQRRYEDFESFVSSMRVGCARPILEHYEGMDRLPLAYRKVLEGTSELLAFLPVVCREEDDPLRAFRVDFLRERQRLGVSLRVIAHDTPIGRRFQSRDAFAHRRTLLISADRCPLAFEKMIASEMVLCVNHEQQRACLIRYSDLASFERSLFLGIWNDLLCTAPTATAAPLPRHAPHADATLRVALSRFHLHLPAFLREFLLSRTSVAATVLSAVFSLAVTYGLYIL